MEETNGIPISPPPHPRLCSLISESFLMLQVASFATPSCAAAAWAAAQIETYMKLRAARHAVYATRRPRRPPHTATLSRQALPLAPLSLSSHQPDKYASQKSRHYKFRCRWQRQFFYLSQLQLQLQIHWCHCASCVCVCVCVYFWQPA